MNIKKKNDENRAHTHPGPRRYIELFMGFKFTTAPWINSKIDLSVHVFLVDPSENVFVFRGLGEFLVFVIQISSYEEFRTAGKKTIMEKKCYDVL